MQFRRVFCVAVLSLSLLTISTGCGDDGGTNPSADAGVDTPDAMAGSPDAMVVDETVVCDDTIPAATSGICDATAGTNTATLIRGNVLGKTTTWENGSVLIENEKIVCVGCDCESHPSYANAKRIDCAGAVVSPGLINAHAHLNFTEGHPIDHGATRYDHRHEWRAQFSTPANPHGTGADANGMRWGELRMMLGGATSYVGFTRANGLLRNLDSLENEDEARGFERAIFDTFSLGDSNRQFQSNCGWDFRRDEREVSGMSAYLPHVAEGINDYAAEEFRCQSSSFDGGQDYVEKNVSHIHAIGLQAVDLYNMARDNARIIWSLRSNISLYGMTAKVNLFHRLGGTIALGTDWTYSGSASVLRELQCADSYNRDYLDGYFTDKQLWEMSTINAAIAAGVEDLTGSLDVGKQADIAVFGGGKDHRTVLKATNSEVAFVMRDGRVLYGEADVLSGIGESCESLTVCGESRAICASREFDGDSFASIQSDVMGGTAAYPAMLCGSPPDEPTCVPSRPGEFTGIADADDSDGDGIANASDNCPTVFNPIRPIDGGSQPDADNDGQGDECDETPLPADIDSDNVPNDSDNCPFDANTDQADTDIDAKGNVCDFCPDTSNPTSVCPLQVNDTAITEIQMGNVNSGSNVSVSGVVVTAVWGLGAWVQDPNAASAQYSGVHVFVGSTPSVNVGDVVNVTGIVGEHHDDTQIENAQITSAGSSAPVSPTDVTLAQAGTEAYEGVLVRITDATGHNPTYDCSVDGSCSDSNLWELTGPGGGIVVFDRCYEDADWASHIGDRPASGVMIWRWNRRRLMPRTGADFPTP